MPGHTLTSERASIFDLLFADLAPPRLSRGVVLVRCPTMKDTPRPEIRLKCRVFRIVIGLRLFLCIQVVEVAEELIEPVARWGDGCCYRRGGSCRTGR
jgi:hypothetical protein